MACGTIHRFDPARGQAGYGVQGAAAGRAAKTAITASKNGAAQGTQLFAIGRARYPSRSGQWRPCRAFVKTAADAALGNDVGSGQGLI